MAVTLVSDMKIYQDEFNAGLYEAWFLNSQIFNQASNGAIQLVTQIHAGDYQKTAYFQRISGLVTRQDIASNASVTPTKLAQAEEVGVKLHRKIGPTDITLKSFNMAGLQTPEGSMALGRLIGDAVLKRMADDALIAAKAAVLGVSALQNDITAAATKTGNFQSLNKTRAKWGDQMGKLAAWIMNSTVFTDIVGDGMANYGFDSVAGVMVANGKMGGFLGAGALITDNSNLINTTPTPDQYYTLGLAAGAVIVKESELQNVVAKVITGTEQLTLEIQGEYANTVSVDGFTWDVTNGGSNPSDSALATSTNWDQVRTDTTGLPL
ncbi:MAG TPA: hypothetical protein ENJ93_09975, partial [Chloroflexi bacterium]|nr:hypothetical protein [Chloroflexota bacterium]